MQPYIHERIVSLTTREGIFPHAGFLTWPGE